MKQNNVQRDFFKDLEIIMYLILVCIVGGLFGAIFGYRPTESVEINCLSALFGYVAIVNFEQKNNLKWQIIFSSIALVSCGFLVYGTIRLVKNLLMILDGDITDMS